MLLNYRVYLLYLRSQSGPVVKLFMLTFDYLVDPYCIHVGYTPPSQALGS